MPITIASFAAITRRLIDRDGFEGFLPTVLFPARKVIRVLEGVPDNAAVGAIALSWAADEAEGHEGFLLAFKTGPRHFRVVRRSARGTSARTFRV